MIDDDGVLLFGGARGFVVRRPFFAEGKVGRGGINGIGETSEKREWCVCFEGRRLAKQQELIKMSCCPEGVVQTGVKST